MLLNIPKLSRLNQQLTLSISGSKSETNRLLLLKAIYPELQIENISNSDDSFFLQKALNQFENWKKNGSNSNDVLTVDIHHAGTAMRFLTSFFACQPGLTVVLTGSSRMQERPIQVLVNALNAIGANISYQNNEGFPPLVIEGKVITENQIKLKANVSSQYITSLMLMASSLKNGLNIQLLGECTSIPYIKMTESLLLQIGVDANFEGQNITVKPFNSGALKQKQVVVESDWSSASYWFSLVALANIGFEITLKHFKSNSLQGDKALVEIYKNFGIQTIFKPDDSITLTKTNRHLDKNLTINLDLVNCPDIAQTIAVSCFGLGLSCYLTGLHTLKIKETDRLEALKAELSKFGAQITVDNHSLTLQTSTTINNNISVKTYQDHRMAMAFAPLALITSLSIEDAEVVNKSYPNFWEDMQLVGFKFS